LSEKVQRDFHGLGFTILEGYGLTEASPVLTVTRPENRMLTGTSANRCRASKFVLPNPTRLVSAK
jgi:long-chain acyl-CoA synthetase